MQTRLEQNQKVKYNLGSYNRFNDKEQWIRITEGCPHNCPFCYETQQIKIFDVPKIVRTNVKIMDMNLLCKKEALNIINSLPKAIGKYNNIVAYDLICGIDYRFITQEIAYALRKKGFKKIRIAWDWFMKDQYKIKDSINMLLKVGYQPNKIMIFMICNWKIPYEECCNKLDLCKVWNTQVADCYYDDQTFPNVIPINWSDKENKDFRSKCRKHNQLVNFRIDPEIKQ